MTFHFKRRRTRGPLPAWPFVGLGLGMLGALGWAISFVPARWLPPCGFHVVTGHPCPSCGATRMSQLMLRGHVVQAFKMNPFFAVILTGLGAWFLVGAGARLAGRDFTINVGEREEKWLWLGAGAAFLLNWLYLWKAGI